MRFDWYQATVSADPDHVLRALEAEFSAESRGSRGFWGYQNCSELVVGEDVRARVLHGGAIARPHVLMSGSEAPPLAAALRDLWPSGHEVARMDACEDFDGPGTWDRLVEPLLRIADERQLSIDQAGDWHRLEAGRTLYVGSPKSAVRVRLYEKGKELRVKGIDPAASLDLCRLEVQVRPQGKSRFVAATGSPDDAWGYSVWSRAVAAELLALDVPRVAVKEGRLSNDERAIRHLAKQYAGPLSRRAAATSWEELALQLQRRVMAEMAGREDH